MKRQGKLLKPGDTVILDGAYLTIIRRTSIVAEDGGRVYEVNGGWHVSIKDTARVEVDHPW